MKFSPLHPAGDKCLWDLLYLFLSISAVPILALPFFLLHWTHLIILRLLLQCYEHTDLLKLVDGSGYKSKNLFLRLAYKPYTISSNLLSHCLSLQASPPQPCTSPVARTYFLMHFCFYLSLLVTLQTGQQILMSAEHFRYKNYPTLTAYLIHSVNIYWCLLSRKEA